ncbi:hypothetical protein CQW23_05475 [Capsicum baccatum]|uniref:Cell morphogenesis central region domain-containing protein n=1 Tax=Capsicum baccatum TaxID=33114 RepID=A0A2G2XHQ2_CAPBA|nr:hypothetical protein CQW23_05475 [Capsicum baccatum]
MDNWFCRHLPNQLNDPLINQVYREQNAVVHTLAHFGPSMHGSSIRIFQHPPPFVMDLLQADREGLTLKSDPLQGGDPSRQICDDALQMLETLSIREWADDGMEGSGSCRAAIVGNLPDSYQQFQCNLCCKLAKDHPELSQLRCEEIMQRHLMLLIQLHSIKSSPGWLYGLRISILGNLRTLTGVRDY